MCSCKSKYDKISICKTTKDIWEKIEVTHEGTTKVKEDGIGTLVNKYDPFKMGDDEGVEYMFSWFS